MNVLRRPHDLNILHVKRKVEEEVEGQELKYEGFVVSLIWGDRLFITKPTFVEQHTAFNPHWVEKQPLTEIPKEHVFPPIEDGMTIYEEGKEGSAEGVYVKIPSFNYYDSDKPDDIPDALRREIRILEILRLHPHYNIVAYKGCRVRDGLAAGICLERFDDNLVLRLAANCKVDTAALVEALTSATKHLHQLGLCHNDISPGNILFREDGSVGLTDFDACAPVGSPKCKDGTFYFTDRNQKMSSPDNDVFSIGKVVEYIRTRQGTGDE